MHLATFEFINKNKYGAKYFNCHLGWQRPKGKGLFLNLKILDSSEAYFLLKVSPTLCRMENCALFTLKMIIALTVSQDFCEHFSLKIIAEIAMAKPSKIQCNLTAASKPRLRPTQ